MKKTALYLITALVVLGIALGLLIAVGLETSGSSPPIFTIPGHTHVISSGNLSGMELSQGFRTGTQDYGPLMILPAFANATMDSGTFTLLTFDNMLPSPRPENLTLPIALFGREYTAELKGNLLNSPVPDRYLYSGQISGLENSRIKLFLTDTNLISGSISLADDYLEIGPVQNREYSQSTQNPLHIVYSVRDIPKPSGTPMPVDPL